MSPIATLPISETTPLTDFSNFRLVEITTAAHQLSGSSTQKEVPHPTLVPPPSARIVTLLVFAEKVASAYVVGVVRATALLL